MNTGVNECMNGMWPEQLEEFGQISCSDYEQHWNTFCHWHPDCFHFSDNSNDDLFKHKHWSAETAAPVLLRLCSFAPKWYWSCDLPQTWERVVYINGFKWCQKDVLQGSTAFITFHSELKKRFLVVIIWWHIYRKELHCTLAKPELRPHLLLLLPHLPFLDCTSFSCCYWFSIFKDTDQHAHTGVLLPALKMKVDQYSLAAGNANTHRSQQ